MDQLQADVSAWAEREMPDSSIETNVTHILDKAVDLWRLGVREDGAPPFPPDIERKIASLGLLLLHLSNRFGVSFETLLREKHAIDKESRFAHDPVYGYSKRVI